MRQLQRIPVFVSLLVLVCCFTATAFAANQIAKDKTLTIASQVPPTTRSVTPANPPLPSGSKVGQGTVTPDVPARPLCPAFEEYKNEPAQFHVIDRPGGISMCPPGYTCSGEPDSANRCFYACHKTRQRQMYADDPACKWTGCENACQR